MHPILLDHPYIGSYRICLLCGFLFGFLLARWRANRAGLEPRHIDNVTLLVAAAGIIGGRFFSRYFYYPTPLSFWQALKVWEDGGLVFYGGVIFGMATVLIYSYVQRVSLMQLFDVLAAPLALGLAFGRVGCFLVGCCWGDVCVDAKVLQNLTAQQREQLQTLPLISSSHFPLAVRFPSTGGAFEQHQALGLIGADATRSLPVHPVQLYEAALAAILCLFLHNAFKRNQADGDIFFQFGIGYGVIRFTMELLRADSHPTYLGFLTISQCISLAFIIVCGAALYLRRRQVGILRPLTIRH